MCSASRYISREMWTWNWYLKVNAIVMCVRACAFIETRRRRNGNEKKKLIHSSNVGPLVTIIILLILILLHILAINDCRTRTIYNSFLLNSRSHMIIKNQWNLFSDSFLVLMVFFFFFCFMNWCDCVRLCANCVIETNGHPIKKWTLNIWMPKLNLRP